MTIDSVTAVQYSGYFQNFVRKSYEAGKVAEETKEAIFQRKSEEERKRIQPIEEFKGKLVDRLI
jgi:hypothetical protein